MSNEINGFASPDGPMKLDLAQDTALPSLGSSPRPSKRSKREHKPASFGQSDGYELSPTRKKSRRNTPTERPVATFRKHREVPYVTTKLAPSAGHWIEVPSESTRAEAPKETASHTPSPPAPFVSPTDSQESTPRPSRPMTLAASSEAPDATLVPEHAVQSPEDLPVLSPKLAPQSLDPAVENAEPQTPLPDPAAQTAVTENRRPSLSRSNSAPLLQPLTTSASGSAGPASPVNPSLPSTQVPSPVTETSEAVEHAQYPVPPAGPGWGDYLRNGFYLAGGLFVAGLALVLASVANVIAYFFDMGEAPSPEAHGIPELKTAATGVTSEPSPEASVPQPAKPSRVGQVRTLGGTYLFPANETDEQRAANRELYLEGVRTFGVWGCEGEAFAVATDHNRRLRIWRQEYVPNSNHRLRFTLTVGELEPENSQLPVIDLLLNHQHYSVLCTAAGDNQFYTRHVPFEDAFVVDVPGDGNCLYHAMAYALEWPCARPLIDAYNALRMAPNPGHCLGHTELVRGMRRMATEAREISSRTLPQVLRDHIVGIMREETAMRLALPENEATLDALVISQLGD